MLEAKEAKTITLQNDVKMVPETFTKFLTGDADLVETFIEKAMQNADKMVRSSAQIGFRSVWIKTAEPAFALPNVSIGSNKTEFVQIPRKWNTMNSCLKLIMQTVKVANMNELVYYDKWKHCFYLNKVSYETLNTELTKKFATRMIAKGYKVEPADFSANIIW